MTPRSAAKSSSAQFDVHMDGGSFHVETWAFAHDQIDLAVDGLRQRVTVMPGDQDAWWVQCSAGTFKLYWLSPLPAGKAVEDSAGSLRAPMPGQVIRVNVSDGQQVTKGDVLLIIEAMKMEHRIKAPFSGKVMSIYYEVGQSVQQGVKLLDLQASEPE